MPAQQRLGLHEEEGVSPSADVPGEQHQQRPIRPRQGGGRYATAQDQQLLTQQGILGEQLRPAPQQSAAGPRHVRPSHRPRPAVGAEGTPQRRDETSQPAVARASKHSHVGSPLLRGINPREAHPPRQGVILAV